MIYIMSGVKYIGGFNRYDLIIDACTSITLNVCNKTVRIPVPNSPMPD